MRWRIPCSMSRNKRFHERSSFYPRDLYVGEQSIYGRAQSTHPTVVVFRNGDLSRDILQTITKVFLWGHYYIFITLKIRRPLKINKHFALFHHHSNSSGLFLSLVGPSLLTCRRPNNEIISQPEWLPFFPFTCLSINDLPRRFSRDQYKILLLMMVFLSHISGSLS